MVNSLQVEAISQSKKCQVDTKPVDIFNFYEEQGRYLRTDVGRMEKDDWTGRAITWHDTTAAVAG